MLGGFGGVIGVLGGLRGCQGLRAARLSFFCFSCRGYSLRCAVSVEVMCSCCRLFVLQSVSNLGVWALLRSRDSCFRAHHYHPAPGIPNPNLAKGLSSAGSGLQVLV